MQSLPLSSANNECFVKACRRSDDFRRQCDKEAKEYENKAIVDVYSVRHQVFSCQVHQIKATVSVLHSKERCLHGRLYAQDACTFETKVFVARRKLMFVMDRHVTEQRVAHRKGAEILAQMSTCSLAIELSPQ